MTTPSSPDVAAPRRARASLRLALVTFVLGVATVVATGTGVTVAGAAVLEPPTSDTTSTSSTTTTTSTTSTTTRPPAPPTTRPPAPPTTRPPAPPTTRPPAPPPPPGPPPAPRARGWSVFISLGRQHAYVYLNGALVKDIPVSSGARGQTPRGTFRVYSKSSLTSAEGDPSVTMRFMTRFRGGIGFHGIPRKNGRPLATPLGIRPVSHGCIRMADLNAAWIYGNVPVGSTVVVK